MTGIGENTLAQPVKPPLRERRACLAKLVKNRLTLTADELARIGGWAAVRIGFGDAETIDCETERTVYAAGTE